MFDALQFIADFFGDIYGFLESMFVQLGAWFVVWYYKILAVGISFSWEVGKTILINIGISQHLNDAWSHIDSSVLQLATFFRIPEAISILLNAYATRFSMIALGIGR